MMRKFLTHQVLLLVLLTVVFLLAAVALAVLPGVGKPAAPPEPAARFHVQVVLKARANPPDYWRVVEQGIAMAAEEFGLYCEVEGPSREIDIDDQIELVRRAIEKKPDVLVLAAGDYERLVPVCAEVVEAGIKLIILDSDVNYDGKACFVGTDNFELGQKMGRLVGGMLGEGERFGVIGHVESSHTAFERRRGLLDTADTDKLSAIAFCDGLREVARQQAMEMIKDDPDISCMVGLNESSVLGICDAIEDLGLIGGIQVVACDSSEDEIKYMENGTIQAFVIQNPFNMGYLSMRAAAQLLEGQRVDPVINTGSVTITREEMYLPENQKLLFPFTNT